MAKTSGHAGRLPAQERLVVVPSHMLRYVIRLAVGHDAPAQKSDDVGVRQLAQNRKPAAKKLVDVRIVRQNLQPGEARRIVRGMDAICSAMEVLAEFRVDHPVADSFTDHAVGPVHKYQNRIPHVREQPMTSTALLLIAHGSRRPEANADLEHLADVMRGRGEFAIVQPSYLELCEPGIVAGGSACVAAGANCVVLLPYFLSAGRHVVEDLTAAREELARAHPETTFMLAEPLGRHPLLAEIVAERARAKLQSETNRA